VGWSCPTASCCRRCANTPPARERWATGTSCIWASSRSPAPPWSTSRRPRWRRSAASRRAASGSIPTRTRRRWRGWSASAAITAAPSSASSSPTGRKASTDLPWRGGKPLAPGAEGGWDTVGPSAEPYGPGWHQPTALDRDGLARIKQAFVAATERALRLDFDLIEIHSAHGYLLHQFLSPISNRRNDAYGGDLAGRLRFPLEVFEAVRAAWPRERALGLRLSATDWVPGGWDVAGSVAYAEALKARGCDFIVASSGGSSPDQEIQAGPGYQTSFAADIRRGAGIATMAVGQISEPRQAETILRSGQADMIALGRGLLYDPHWPWHAAEALGAQAAYPAQYLRCHPTLQGMPVPGNPPPPKPG
jgi:2,4-dienoyl-CoA reductase-like NADH-dependent reductase (Old Yellow Enzyme family)